MTDRLILTRDLEALLHDYWHEVDMNNGRDAAAYYTEDAVFEASGGTRYEGRARIAEFYRYRADRGARTSVHMVSNFRAVPMARDAATCTWYLTLYAADGAPVHRGTQPILIAAMTDDCRRIGGRWLYARRTFRALFRDGIAVVALPVAAP